MKGLTTMVVSCEMIVVHLVADEYWIMVEMLMVEGWLEVEDVDGIMVDWLMVEVGLEVEEAYLTLVVGKVVNDWWGKIPVVVSLVMKTRRVKD
jgi:hypothetical protein